MNHSGVSEKPDVHRGFTFPDPFAHKKKASSSIATALLATAIFRCWHLLIFFGSWATAVTFLNVRGYNLSFTPTLLTVCCLSRHLMMAAYMLTLVTRIGTVLGFVISYRTTSSFERYNEGRRLWSQIILSSRMLGRLVWFHIPDPPPNTEDGQTVEDAVARSLVEKKTIINLVEAFGVAVKHYLRGEDGIYYQDLYYLVKFLPAYALPAGRPSLSTPQQHDLDASVVEPQTPPETFSSKGSPQTQGLGVPVSSRGQSSITIATPTVMRQRENATVQLLPAPVSLKSSGFTRGSTLTTSMSPNLTTTMHRERLVLAQEDESCLLPARLPPKYSFFDLFPFSLFVNYLTNRGKELKGKKAAKLRAKLRKRVVSGNLPLEITLYMSSYIASLQRRKFIDVPTTNALLATVQQLVDSLTGLERILTTPIPFSYSFHLWAVTIIYCLALPSQIWGTLRWMTIPATVVLSFIFFGFLVAGEEIENPFGYDKNDLNLDHFTNNIIHAELHAITSTSPPDPTHWAFSDENNLLFSDDVNERITPNDWVERGPDSIKMKLSKL